MGSSTKNEMNGGAPGEPSLGLSAIATTCYVMEVVITVNSDQVAGYGAEL